MIPKYKPQILDEIYLNEKKIGVVLGINLKAMDFNKEEEINSFIMNIQKINKERISTIYIEGCDKFSKDIIDKIESTLDVKFASGNKIRTHNFKNFLKGLPSLLNNELSRNDLLILSSDKNKLIDIIKSLPQGLNCIANLGIKEDNLYEDILNETGVSIYEPYKIDKAIKNFHIIINYSEEVLFDISKIKSRAIILDFSKGKPLEPVRKLNKNIIYIDDFIYHSKLNSKWIDSSIDSRLYETIYPDRVERFHQIYADGSSWFLEEYMAIKIKKRGRL